jgi:hypothetical protein
MEGDHLTLVESDGGTIPPSVLQTATLLLKPGAPAENAEALRRLLWNNKVKVRTVTVCLPHRLAAVKSARVPSVDPHEIRSMALLQACRLLPFSPEDIVAGHECVDTSSGGFSHLLLTVMRREEVDPVVSLCRAAGLLVNRIFLDSQALSSLVAEQMNNPCLLVLAEDREGMVAMIDKRRPRFVRTFPWDGSADVLAREACLSVEAYQSEMPFWNPAKVIWCGLDSAGTIRKTLGITLNAPVGVYEWPDTLDSPAARNAYAAANAPVGGTNLLPEIEQKRQLGEMKTRHKKVFGLLTLSVALVALFAENGDGGVTAVFEKPIAMPRQASQSTLAAGRGVGLIEGVLAALRVPYESIAPSAWKAQMGIPKGSTKDVSRARALALFPALAGQLSRKKDDGRELRDAQGRWIGWIAVRREG